MQPLSQLKQSIVRTTLVDSVYETLLAAILSGRLEPETELSVVALARELDVSRTPVHDALRQLAKDGLVQQEVNRKARVARFSTDDVAEIFEMRKLLEGAAAEAAATGMDAEDLERLDATAESLAATHGHADWLARWVDFDAEFHETIAKASGNNRLWQDIARYRLLHRWLNRFITNVDGLQTALAEHQEILAALKSRKPAAARRAMVAHIGAWQAFFVEHYPR